MTLLFVLVLHLGLVLSLFFGLAEPHAKTQEGVLELTVGGPLGKPIKTVPLVPQFAVVTAPDVVLPTVTADDTTANALNGSPNVSTPAEAIAGQHAFPALPATELAARSPVVRLLLWIDETGRVSDARVGSTSGVPTLDSLAISWVKAHWRYRPAMQNGTAIAVSTTALLQFVSRS